MLIISNTKHNIWFRPYLNLFGLKISQEPTFTVLSSKSHKKMSAFLNKIPQIFKHGSLWTWVACYICHCVNITMEEKKTMYTSLSDGIDSTAAFPSLSNVL